MKVIILIKWNLNLIFILKDLDDENNCSHHEKLLDSNIETYNSIIEPSPKGLSKSTKKASDIKLFKNLNFAISTTVIIFLSINLQKKC